MKKSTEHEGMYGNIKIPKKLLGLLDENNICLPRNEVSPGEEKVVRNLINFKREVLSGRLKSSNGMIRYNKKVGVNCSTVEFRGTDENSKIHMWCYLPYLCMEERFVTYLIELGLAEFSYRVGVFGNLSPLYIPKYNLENIRVSERSISQDIWRLILCVLGSSKRVLNLRTGNDGSPILDTWFVSPYEPRITTKSEKYEELHSDVKALFELLLDYYEDYMKRSVKEMFFFMTGSFKGRMMIIGHEDGEDSLVFY